MRIFIQNGNNNTETELKNLQRQKEVPNIMHLNIHNKPGFDTYRGEGKSRNFLLPPIYSGKVHKFHIKIPY